MTDKYEDIIHLPHHVSKTRPQMSLLDRAAQFSPFAALSGHGIAIKETARLTDARIEPDENVKEILSNRLQIIADRLDEQLEIEIVYFQPDMRKVGGAYDTVTGTIKKIDEYERIVIMDDGTSIPIDEIISIDGPIFEMLLLHECDD